MLPRSVGPKTIASNCGAARLIEAAFASSVAHIVDVTVNHVYSVSQLTHSHREAPKARERREEGAGTGPGARVVGTAALMH